MQFYAHITSFSTSELVQAPARPADTADRLFVVKFHIMLTLLFSGVYFWLVRKDMEICSFYEAMQELSRTKQYFLHVLFIGCSSAAAQT